MEAFKIHILGCGSALPTLHHNASSQVVEIREKLFLVDCGEGTQMQLRKAHVHFARLNHVFISHIHGDHCFGLIGMLSTFGMLGRTAKMHIYAPKELFPLLRQQLKLFCSDLGYEIEFHEVDTTVQSILYEDRSLQIESIPLCHRVPTCGFLFKEKPTLPHIRRDMIDFYGIPCAQINNIKAGQGWTTPDGEVIPHERLVIPADSPRSYAYCSDTHYLPELYQQIKRVSALYHESTYGDDYQHLAEKYYHSTARQAAMVARDAEAGMLILGHYSSRYEDEQVLLNEAKEVFGNTILADELRVFEL